MGSPPQDPQDERPADFPARVSRRVVQVGWGVIWPWVAFLLLFGLLVLLSELLKLLSAVGLDSCSGEPYKSSLFAYVIITR